MNAREYASASEMLESYGAGKKRLGLLEPVPVVRGPVVRIPRPPVPTKSSSGMHILQWVAHKHALSVKDILTASRMTHISNARHEAMWLMREWKGWSFTRIATAVGLSDHTSVMHGCQAHAQRLSDGTAVLPTFPGNRRDNPVRGLEVVGTTEEHGRVAAGQLSPAKSVPLATSTSPSV